MRVLRWSYEYQLSSLHCHVLYQLLSSYLYALGQVLTCMYAQILHAYISLDWHPLTFNLPFPVSKRKQQDPPIDYLSTDLSLRFTY